MNIKTFTLFCLLLSFCQGQQVFAQDQERSKVGQFLFGPKKKGVNNSTPTAALVLNPTGYEGKIDTAYLGSPIDNSGEFNFLFTVDSVGGEESGVGTIPGNPLVIFQEAYDLQSYPNLTQAWKIQLVKKQGLDWEVRPKSVIGYYVNGVFSYTLPQGISIFRDSISWGDIQPERGKHSVDTAKNDSLIPLIPDIVILPDSIFPDSSFRQVKSIRGLGKPYSRATPYLRVRFTDGASYWVWYKDAQELHGLMKVGTSVLVKVYDTDVLGPHVISNIRYWHPGLKGNPIELPGGRGFFYNATETNVFLEKSGNLNK